MSTTGSTSQDSVREWLTTTITEGDAKHEPLTEAVEPLRRNPSSDDDLALGVEGKQPLILDLWRRSSPALSRWNSLSSATSGHSGPLSVMDILNLWNDDPEEVLLDLGFGCDEPDLSGRIPARFINHQSQARGINLQVFLEAQKNRLDLENPDVSNRFRQLEVLQQVTTAFSSLVGSSSSSSLFRAPPGKDLAPEARERRKRMGMLLRRASKKSQSQICHSPNTQDPTTPPATTPPSASTGSLQLPPSLGDEKVLLKRVKPGLQETVCLSPLVEEQGASPDPQLHMASFNVREGALRHRPLREVRGMIRTNSGQSDSSGFLEEPFIPSLPQLQSPGPDLFKSDEDCPTLPHLSPNQTIPVCQPALSSPSHDPDGLIDSAVGRISNLTEPEQSISQQDRPCPHDDNTDPAPASPVQDVIHIKMDHLSMDLEDTLQRNEKGEGEDERHSYTVQTQESVYISDTESSASLSEGSRLVSEEVCYETEIGPQVPSCSLHELSAETKQEEFSKVSQVEIDNTESKSPRSYLVLHDEAQEAHSRTEVEASDLIEIESLDLVFETSVDGSEGEYGDVDAFFQQIDTEGRVYWAEPIQVSSTTPVLGESGSIESSDAYPENTLFPRGSAVLDSFSSTDTSLALAPFSSFSTPPSLKPSSRSVSVQMSSSPSSHIVHRKDVPYVTDSKHTLLPSVLPLDTSTPFRAVQSWTDLHIQRNTLTKKLSHGDFSSSPSFPLLSTDCQSHDCLPGLARNYQTVSVSMDTGLSPDEDEELDRNGNEDEEKLGEAHQAATMVCCCSCDHQCTSCTHNSYTTQHTLGNIPYSLSELEEMMLCLQQFRSVLSNMEEQLSEDQAAVYSALSEQDRENVRDIEELRRAVKQEAGELEMQLNELAHHYGDSLKM
eukprot:superscaffoldBa00000124_g1813